jgi:predicted RNase H-like nuclease
VLALGVDGCATGWVAVAIEVEGGGFRGAAWAPTIDKLPDAAGVGIDMPIGLLAEGLRTADGLARREVGPRGRSVFLTPPRPVLEVEDHAEATALAVRLTGAGVSRQAHGLRRKILEVDAWLPRAGGPVWEVHPEVSFTILGRRPLPPKNSWNGAAVRRRLLAAAGLELPGDLGPAGQAQVDDVLDAAVVAWSCRRLLRGEGRSWPDPPQPGLGGYPIAIWA